MRCIMPEAYFSRAEASNYIPQILWDVITCPCPWYMLLAQHSSYELCPLILVSRYSFESHFSMFDESCHYAVDSSHVMRPCCNLIHQQWICRCSRCLLVQDHQQAMLIFPWRTKCYLYFLEVIQLFKCECKQLKIGCWNRADMSHWRYHSF